MTSLWLVVLASGGWQTPGAVCFSMQRLLGGSRLGGNCLVVRSLGLLDLQGVAADRVSWLLWRKPC